MIHVIDLNVLDFAQLVKRQPLTDDRFVLCICVNQIANRHDYEWPPFLCILLLYHKRTQTQRLKKIFFHCVGLVVAGACEGVDKQV